MSDPVDMRCDGVMAGDHALVGRGCREPHGFEGCTTAGVTRPAAPCALRAALVAALCVWGAAAAVAAPSARRAFDVTLDGRWIGEAVAFSPYRDGQSPGGAQPTRAQVAEDARLVARRWSLVRTYGSTGPAEDLLAVIRAERLPVRVMLGVWVAPEERRDSTGRVVERFPAARAANRAEREAAVRLANAYPDVVRAVCVGNETQVFWSAHRLPADALLRALREVRARTRVPVATADDYHFWNRPESRRIAAIVDFIVLHAHPMWNGKQLEEAVAWTDSIVASIRAAHRGVPVVLGETGWATRRHTEGDQGRLIHGRADEEAQQVFFDSIHEWTRRTLTVTFFFEAFDENWKGGPHPDEVEKHWGLYRADRSPKPAVAGMR
jgi:exo-beta-1,3-glucanase (GH17 family)